MSPLYDLPLISHTYFFPMPGDPLPETASAGPVDLALADGTPIGGYWSRPLHHCPTILYLHGNGECIAHQLGHWPTWAAQAGANIFFVDYPGYASSAGEPSLSGCCGATAAALRWLLARPADEVPAVVLMGRSVGSIFALDAAAAAASPRVAGLVLESGVADVAVRLALRVDYEAWGIDRAAVEAELTRDFDHRQKLGSLDIPVMLLHTRHDDLVPSENSEAMARWAEENLFRLVLFDEGDHNTIQWLNGAEYVEHLAQFIAALG